MLSIFLHVFLSPVASASKTILKREKFSKNDEDGRNIRATPRPQTLRAPKQYPTSSEHQALDLDGYHPYIPESSQQLSATSQNIEDHPYQI